MIKYSNDGQERHGIYVERQGENEFTITREEKKLTAPEKTIWWVLYGEKYTGPPYTVILPPLYSGNINDGTYRFVDGRD